MFFGGICFITERRLSPLSVEDSVKRALDAGVKWIQYREKALCRRDIFYQAERLRKLTDEYKTTLIINDHADIALAVEADGVHLGQDDLPLKEAKGIMKGKVIGISTHNLSQAKEAEADGAYYIGFGPVFWTQTKDAGSPKGLITLKEVTSSVSLPVVAIGGIKRENLRDIFQQGASAVAVSSGILQSDNIYREAREFVKIIKTLDTVLK